jgi:hypothetical protein
MSLMVFLFLKHATPHLLRINSHLEESGADFQFADGLACVGSRLVLSSS